MILIPMRVKALLAIGSIFLAFCVSTFNQSPEQRIVHQAAAALGGVDNVRGVRTMVMEGGGDVRALGQNRTLDGPLLKWEVTGYRRAVDFEGGRWRDESTQTAAFVTGWPEPAKVIAAYDANVAFDVEDGEASRLDAIAARERRAELYHHPIGFLRAALADRARLEHARTEGNDDAVDLIVAPHDERFTLYVDRGSHLPQRIVSKSHVAPLGDVAITSAFGEFIDVATSGLKVPSRMTKLVDDTVVAELRITKAVVNAPVDTLGGQPALRRVPDGVSPEGEAARRSGRVSAAAARGRAAAQASLRGEPARQHPRTRPEGRSHPAHPRPHRAVRGPRRRGPHITPQSLIARRSRRAERSYLNR
jgi:hypothetical protein